MTSDFWASGKKGIAYEQAEPLYCCINMDTAFLSAVYE